MKLKVKSARFNATVTAPPLLRSVDSVQSDKFGKSSMHICEYGLLIVADGQTVLVPFSNIRSFVIESIDGGE